MKKNNESSNTCIELNLSEEEFCNETTTKKYLALRCNSPLLVPSVAELHRLLSVKFAESIGNTELFIERKSVIEIGKLLKMYHQNCETVQLSKNTYFYLCKRITHSEVPSCEYSSVLTKSFRRDVYCGHVPYIIKKQNKCEQVGGKSDTKNTIQ